MEEQDICSKRLTSQQLRKIKKPMIEKRRRERINESLNQLKTLILEALNKDENQYNKMEKADILELTVKHLKNLHQRASQEQQNTQSSQGQTVSLTTMQQPVLQMVQLSPTILPQNTVDNYKAGYAQCMSEVGSFLQASPSVIPEVKNNVNNLLQMRLCDINLQNSSSAEWKKVNDDKIHHDSHVNNNMSTSYVPILPKNTIVNKDTNNQNYFQPCLGSPVANGIPFTHTIPMLNGHTIILANNQSHTQPQQPVQFTSGDRLNISTNLSNVSPATTLNKENISVSNNINTGIPLNVLSTGNSILLNDFTVKKTLHVSTNDETSQNSQTPIASQRNDTRNLSHKCSNTTSPDQSVIIIENQDHKQSGKSVSLDINFNTFDLHNSHRGNKNVDKNERPHYENQETVLLNKSKIYHEFDYVKNANYMNDINRLNALHYKEQTPTYRNESKHYDESRHYWTTNTINDNDRTNWKEMSVNYSITGDLRNHQNDEISPSCGFININQILETQRDSRRPQSLDNMWRPW